MASPPVEVHHSETYLCGVAIEYYKREAGAKSRKKLFVCGTCKGRVILYLLRVLANGKPLSQSATQVTAETLVSGTFLRFGTVEDDIWATCQLAPHQALQRYRDAFFRGVLHIAKELALNLAMQEPGTSVQTEAVKLSGAQWDNNPLAAYAWWKKCNGDRAVARKTGMAPSAVVTQTGTSMATSPPPPETPPAKTHTDVDSTNSTASDSHPAVPPLPTITSPAVVSTLALLDRLEEVLRELSVAENELHTARTFYGTTDLYLEQQAEGRYPPGSPHIAERLGDAVIWKEKAEESVLGAERRVEELASRAQDMAEKLKTMSR